MRKDLKPASTFSPVIQGPHCECVVGEFKPQSMARLRHSYMSLVGTFKAD